MQFANILSSLEVFDLSETRIDLSTIQNRRFMYHSSGTLILGAENTTKHSRGVLKSHAEEHGEALKDARAVLPPYDEFVRGWIGVGKHYPNGIIHFAPHVPLMCGPYFETAFDFIEKATQNGFNENSMLRGFGEVWERPLFDVLGASVSLPPNRSLEAQIQSARARLVFPDEIGIEKSRGFDCIKTELT